MQTFIPKYRGGEEQTQKYLQDISSMIHESQTFNIRDPQKNGWIDKFPTQPPDMNLASIETKKKYSNPLSVPQNQNFQTNNQRNFDINEYLSSNNTQMPTQGPYQQRDLPFQIERANNKMVGHNPMKEMHNADINMQKMQQELRANQNYKSNAMNSNFEIPQLNSMTPSQRIQSAQPQQKIQYQQQRQPTNSWENFQQPQSAIQVPRLNPNAQLFMNAPVNNVEYAFPNPLQFNQMNLMAYNNQLGYEPQAIPTFQPQEFQVYVLNPEYQLSQAQQQVYLVSQGPQLGFWQPTNQPQQAIFENSQPVRTLMQPNQMTQPIGNSQQFQQPQIAPQNLHFIPPLQAPQNPQNNNFIQQAAQMNSYKAQTQPQPVRSEVSQRQVQQQPQLQQHIQQKQQHQQQQLHKEQKEQKEQLQQQQQQKPQKQQTQHYPVYEESKLAHHPQVSNKQSKQAHKPEPKPNKQSNPVEELFCIPAFPGLPQMEKIQSQETQKVVSNRSLEDLLQQIEELNQKNNRNQFEQLNKLNQFEQQINAKEVETQVQSAQKESEAKTRSETVEKEMMEPQLEMSEHIQKADEVKEDKKEEIQEKMETEDTTEPASNEPEMNNEPESKPETITPKKKTVLKSKEKRKQQKKKHVENKPEQKPEPAKEEPEKMEIDQTNLTSTVSSTPDNSMPVPVPESTTKKVDPKKQNWSYEEVASAMKYLSEFEWLEEKVPGHKFLLTKLLAPPVFWFLVCSEYFPRRNFAGKNIKQLIQETYDKVNSVIPNFTQRLSKDNITPESIQPFTSSESDALFLEKLSQSIKDFAGQNDYERDLASMSNTAALTPLLKTGYSEEDDQWILEMRHYIFDSFKKLEQENDQPKLEEESLPSFDVLAKIELDDLIALYEKDLSGLANENLMHQTDLENKMTENANQAKMVSNLRFDGSDMLADITISFPDEEEDLLSLMERKQNDVKPPVTSKQSKSTGQMGSKTLQKSRGETSADDIVCQVCNDGDFTDNDLIVFCAKCNVAVHQKCYGIVVLPEDDWICDLCINFGSSGKYVRCPLCDKRGGAMKPSPTKVDTDLFVYTNPGYHSFIRSYARTGSYRGVDQKPLSFKDLKRKSGHSKMLKENKDLEEELDYNFHELANANFTNEELKEEPKPFNVWVHLTCVKFIPELFFGDRIHVTNILGFDKVGKERFKSECEVCKKKNNGATITCRKEFCTRGFHAECARRAGYYLDMKENSTNQLQCHIYCNKHTPLQLKRTLEAKEKKKKDEIVKFFKQVEKSYFAHINDIDRFALGPVPETLNFEEEKAPIKKKKVIQETGGDTGAKRREEGYFMKLVETQRKKTSRNACIMSLEPEGEAPEGEIQPYKLIEIKVPLDKDRELILGDPVWEAFSYKGLTPKQKYKKYKEIVKRKAAEAALNEHIEAQEKEQSSPKETADKDEENKVEEAVPMSVEKVDETPCKVTDEPVVEAETKGEEESKVAEEEKPVVVAPEIVPEKEQKSEKQSEFVIKLVKASFLHSLIAGGGAKLSFPSEYLTGSLVIGDMIPYKEELICVCQKPYRGEIMIDCTHCKDHFHPGCVERSDRANWHCKTCESSKMHTEEEALPETEYSESLTSLMGKRPNSNSGSEEEPNPRKKVNFGVNRLGYY